MHVIVSVVLSLFSDNSAIWLEKFLGMKTTMCFVNHSLSDDAGKFMFFIFNVVPQVRWYMCHVECCFLCSMLNCSFVLCLTDADCSSASPLFLHKNTWYYMEINVPMYIVLHYIEMYVMYVKKWAGCRVVEFPYRNITRSL